MESIIGPILTRLPLQLRWGPCRASCETKIGAGGLDDRLIKFVKVTGSKSGPLGRAVEGVVDSAYEADRLVPAVPARFGIIVGGLIEV